MSWKCIFCYFCSDQVQLQDLLEQQDYQKEKQNIDRLIKKIKKAYQQTNKASKQTNTQNCFEDYYFVLKIIKYCLYMNMFDQVQFYLKNIPLQKCKIQFKLQFKLIQFISIVKNYLLQPKGSQKIIDNLLRISKEYQNINKSKDNIDKALLGQNYMNAICQYLQQEKQIKLQLSQQKDKQQQFIMKFDQILQKQKQNKRRINEQDKKRHYEYVSKKWLQKFISFMKSKQNKKNNNQPFFMTHLQICYPNLCGSEQSDFFEVYRVKKKQICLISPQQWAFINICFNGLLMSTKIPKLKSKYKPPSNSNRKYSSNKVQQNKIELKMKQNSNNKKKSQQKKQNYNLGQNQKKESHIQLSTLIVKGEKQIQKQVNVYNQMPIMTQIKVKSKQIGKRGIANMGNTCFMNSALQCLHKTYELSQKLTEYYLNNKNKQCQFIKQIHKLNLQLESNDSSPIYPRKIRKMVEQYNPQFRQNSQNDAGQLILTVLNMIHQESNTVQKIQKSDIHYSYNKSDQQLYEEYKKRDQLRQKSILDECITGRFKTTYKCKCTKEKRLFQKFNVIYLPLTESKDKKASIIFQECLKNFHSHENLPDWNCLDCKKETPHKKRLEFFKMNKILIFCLKRFSTQGHKINAKLQADFLIDLSKYLKNKLYKNGECIYKLYAFINHYGSLRSGHYTSFCQSQKEKIWIQYNDSSVKIVSDFKPQDLGNAYILFYRLIQ